MYFLCCAWGAGQGGGTPLYGLHRNIPLERVWFLASFMQVCPQQGLVA